MAEDEVVKPNIFRILRRSQGLAGPPDLGELASGELAFNEVDEKLYYGKGKDSEKNATEIVCIGGRAWVGNQDDFAFTGDVTGTGSQQDGIVLTLVNVGTAGSYYKVTTDIKGRVTAGQTNLDETDIDNFHVSVRSNRLDQMAVPTADLDMNTVQVKNLTDPTDPQDAATKVWTEAHVDSHKLNEFVVPDGSVDMNNQLVVNVATPTLGHQAANKSYVDSAITGLVGTYVDETGDIMTGQLEIQEVGVSLLLNNSAADVNMELEAGGDTWQLQHQLSDHALRFRHEGLTKVIIDAQGQMSVNTTLQLGALTVSAQETTEPAGVFRGRSAQASNVLEARDIDDTVLWGVHANGTLSASGNSVLPAEFGYLSGVTSALQTQLNTINTNHSSHLADTGNPHAVTQAQVGLGLVENTALSTWPGTTNITTLGTITTGTWEGDVIDPAYIGSHVLDHHSDVNISGLAVENVLQWTGAGWMNRTLAAANIAAKDDFDAHVADTGNPHSVTQAQVGLGLVENTALSTWPGTTNVVTVGTITTGVWQGTPVAAAYLGAHTHAAADTISGTFHDDRIAQSNVTQYVSAIDHDQLLNYSIAQHRVIDDGTVSATALWSSSKIQAEIDTATSGLYDHKGGYNASTNTPDLDVSPSGVKKGDAYTVSADGVFFTEQVRVGDILIADQDDPTLLTHWTRVNHNIDFATTTSPGIVELATDGEAIANVVVQGNDLRLSNDRYPTAHAASHQDGGSDEIATTTAAAFAIPKAIASGKIGDDWISASSVTQHIGSLDHGSMAGLGDDDHTQYLLVDGTRSMTGGLTVNAPTLGAPVAILNSTDSNSGNPLLSFEKGGTEVARMDVEGRWRAGNGALTTPAFSFLNQTSLGAYYDTVNAAMAFVHASSTILALKKNSISPRVSIGASPTFASSLYVLGTSQQADGVFRVDAGDPTVVPILARSAVSQTADMLQLQNNAGDSLVTVDAGGSVSINRAAGSATGAGADGNLNVQRRITLFGDNYYTSMIKFHTYACMHAINANGMAFGAEWNKLSYMASGLWTAEKGYRCWNFTKGGIYGEQYGMSSYADNEVDFTSSVNEAQKVNIYGSRTDASNYERLSLSADGAGNVTIAAVTLGDGTDDVNLNLTPAGAGEVVIGGNLNLSNAGTRQITGISSGVPSRYIQFDSNGNLSSNFAWAITASLNGVVANTGYVIASSLGNNDGVGIIGSSTRTEGYGGELMVYGYGHATYPGAFRLRGAPLLHDVAGSACYITGVTAFADATTNLDGGHIHIEGGDGAANSAGDADGGNLYLSGGTGYGTGSDGGIFLQQDATLSTSKYLRAGADPTNRYIDVNGLWRNNLAITLDSRDRVILYGGTIAQAYFSVEDNTFLGGIWGTGDIDYIFGGTDQDAVPSRGIQNVTLKAGSANASPGAGASIYGGSVTIQGGHGASGEAGAAHGGNIYLNPGTGYGTGLTGQVVVNGSNSDTSLATFTVYGHDDTDESVVIRATASQTVNTFAVQTSTGADLFTVDRYGVTTLKSGTNKFFILESTAAGTPANYVQFRDTGGDTGYFGFGSGSDDKFTIQNSVGGDIHIHAFGGGDITLTSTAMVEFAASVDVSVHNNYDFGTVSSAFRDGYFSRDLYVAGDLHLSGALNYSGDIGFSDTSTTTSGDLDDGIVITLNNTTTAGSWTDNTGLGGIQVTSDDSDLGAGDVLVASIYAAHLNTTGQGAPDVGWVFQTSNNGNVVTDFLIVPNASTPGGDGYLVIPRSTELRFGGAGRQNNYATIYHTNSGGGDLVFELSNFSNNNAHFKDGQVQLGGSSVNHLGTVTIHGHDAGDEALVIRAASTQTVDILTIQNNAGSEMLSVQEDGLIRFGNTAGVVPEIYNFQNGQPLRILSRDDIVLDIAHLNDGNLQDFRVTAQDETVTMFTINENSQIHAYGQTWVTDAGGSGQGTAQFNIYTNEGSRAAAVNIQVGASQNTLLIAQYGGTSTMDVSRQGSVSFNTPTSSPVHDATVQSRAWHPSYPAVSMTPYSTSGQTHSLLEVKDYSDVSTFNVFKDGVTVIGGSSSLATTTIYGHDAGSNILRLRPQNSQTASMIRVDKHASGGHVFSVTERPLGCIAIGELDTPSKETHIFAQYAQTDPTGDIMGIYMNEYLALTANGSPSLRGVWIDNVSGYAQSGITWSGPSYIGFYGTQYVNTGSHQGTIQNQYSFRGSVGIQSCGVGGAVTNSYIFYGETLNNSTNGTITNAYGLYLTSSQATGTVTNRYGIWVDQGSNNDMVSQIEGVLRVGRDPESISGTMVVRGHDDTAKTLVIRENSGSQTAQVLEVQDDLGAYIFKVDPDGMMEAATGYRLKSYQTTTNGVECSHVFWSGAHYYHRIHADYLNYRCGAGAGESSDARLWMQVNASNGFVGLGGTPSQLLHLHSGRLAVDNGFNIGSVDASTGMFVTQGTDIFFQVNNNTSVYIKEDKLGVGVSPDHALHILGSADVAKIGNGTRDLYIAQDTGGVSMGNGALQTGEFIYLDENNGGVRIYTNATEHMRIDSTGRVGIGVSPSSALEIDVTGYAATAHALFVRDGEQGAVTTDWRPYNGSTTASLRIQSTATNAFVFAPTTAGQTELVVAGGAFDIYPTVTFPNGISASTPAVRFDGQTTTFNGTTSLGTVTIIGHDEGDETLVIRADANQTSPTLALQNSGGNTYMSWQHDKSEMSGGRLAIAGGDAQVTSCTSRAQIETHYNKTNVGATTYSGYFRQVQSMTAAAPSINYNVVGLHADVASVTHYSGVSNLGSMTALSGNAAQSGTSNQGTVANSIGVYSQAGVSSCGAGYTLTNAYGLHVYIQNIDADATIASAFGIYVNNSDQVGTITNRHGIYVTQGTANDMVNQLEGILRVGKDPDVSQGTLTVNGHANSEYVAYFRTFGDTGSQGTVRVINDSTASWAETFTITNPSAPNDTHAAGIYFGRDRTTDELGHLTFMPSATAQLSRVQIGIWGRNDLLTIQGDGAVGVGVPIPTYRLDVHSTSSGVARFSGSGDKDLYVYTDAGGTGIIHEQANYSGSPSGIYMTDTRLYFYADNASDALNLIGLTANFNTSNSQGTVTVVGHNNTDEVMVLESKASHVGKVFDIHSGNAGAKLFTVTETSSEAFVGVNSDPDGTYNFKVLGTGRPMLIESNDAANICKFGNTGTGVGTYNGFDISINNDASSDLRSYGMPLKIFTSSTNGVDGTRRMHIAGGSQALVSIGDTDPSNVLHVYQSDSAVGEAQVMVEGRSGGYGAGIEFASRLQTSDALTVMGKITADGEASWDSADSATQDSGLRFYTTLDGTLSEVVRIRANGDVGFGSGAPDVYGWGDRSLSVVGSGTNQNTNIDIVATGNGSSAVIFGGGAGTGTSTAVGRAAITSLDGSHLIFSTNAANSGSSFTERMRVTSDGDVIVNGSTGLATLTVIGRTSSDPALVLRGGGTNSAATKFELQDAGAANIFTVGYADFRYRNYDGATWPASGAIIMVASNTSHADGTFHFADQRSSQTSPSFVFDVASTSQAAKAYDLRLGNFSNFAMWQNGDMALGAAFTPPSGSIATREKDFIVDYTSATARKFIGLRRDNAAVAYFGVANAADDLIMGVAAGDIVMRTVNVDMFFSVDNGSDYLLSLTNAGYIETKGGIRRKTVEKTGAYTATVADHVIDCTSGTWTLTLPAASGIDGQEFIIKNSGSGTITVDGDASETIDGNTTHALTQDQSITVVARGGNWLIVAQV